MPSRFGDHSSIVRCEQSAKLAGYPRSLNAPCGVRIEVTLFGVTTDGKPRPFRGCAWHQSRSALRAGTADGMAAPPRPLGE